MRFLSTPYTITCPDFTLYHTDTRQPVYPFLQAILLAYLQQADGAPRVHEWISFHALPGGQFYHRAFQGYTGGHMAARLGDDIAAFARGASALAEVRLSDYGDAAYSFRVLPNLYMAAVYWRGDDEFDPRANLLFDRSASHYLPIDGLAVVGSWLTSKIIKGASAPGGAPSAPGVETPG